MADGHSQATKAKTNPRVRNNTKKDTKFNWSISVHSHNLVTFLVHQNLCAHTSRGTMLSCLHHLLKHSPFAQAHPIPVLAVEAEAMV